VLFEIIFVAALTLSLQQSEYTAWKASHSQAVLAEANDLMVALYKTSFNLMLFATTKHASFKDKFNSESNEIPAGIERLKALEAGDPNGEAALSRIDALSSKLLRTLSETRNDLDSENETAIKEYFWQMELGSLVQQAIHEIDEFIKAAADVRRIDLEEQNRIRNIVIGCLAGGLLLNVGIAGALVFLFGRGIVDRIAVMVDNTRKVADSLSLNPVVEGTDEIAELDIFMHKMADHLKESEERRKEILAMVSHDLRSPITAVNGALMLILNNVIGQFDEKVRHELELAERNTQRLIYLINDLLDVEKMAVGKLEISKSWVDVDTMLNEASIALKGMGDQKKVTIEAATTKLTTFADAPRVVQVIINLCGNSIKFSPEGGTITLNAIVKDGGVEFSVKDQGRGISQEFQEKLFGRFEQNKDEGIPKIGSSGLGLYICKNLVALHGGAIGVESEIGKGSRFWFFIPAPTESESAAAGKKPATEGKDEELSW
jgi:signal transduction histidine kinase